MQRKHLQEEKQGGGEAGRTCEVFTNTTTTTTTTSTTCRALLREAINFPPNEYNKDVSPRGVTRRHALGEVTAVDTGEGMRGKTRRRRCGDCS